MDLLCEEEISWSPCSPLFDTDHDSTCDQSIGSISSPDSIASNCSIHCSSISSFHSSSILNCNSINHQCSSNCSPINHPSSSNCNINDFRDFSTAAVSVPCGFWPPVEEHELDHLLEKEVDYMPEKNYLAGLQMNDLYSARSTALQWLTEAQCSFNFSSTTIALAINYFDRYLARNLSKVWTPWMLELLCTACLSTAAKMEEVFVPQLPDLQVGTRKHAFDTATVRRMELLLLSTLQWKMRSITPFSFVELAFCGFTITPHLQNLLFIRISELLIVALLEASFQQFRPSIVATTSIYCALEQLAPSQIDQFKSTKLAMQTLHKNEDEFWHCYRQMEAEVVDPATPSRTPSPSNDDEVVHILTDAEGPLGASTRHNSSQNFEVIAGFLFESLFTTQKSSTSNNNKSYVCLCAFSSCARKRKRAQDMD